MNAVSAARTAVAALLGAIESRDLRRVAEALSPDASWQNVPHPPLDGRDAVVGLLGGVITWSDRVVWEVVSESYEAGRAHLERVDRFLIDGEWHAVRCNGVFETDTAGRVREVRDYVDLEEWRRRIGPRLERLADRPAIDVVRRHLDAVTTGDVVSMAADYAVDAVLVRGDDQYQGWAAIADYFDTVPARLGGCSVDFRGIEHTAAGEVATTWSIVGDGTAAGGSGTDTFVVTDGRISRQVVALDGRDF